MTNLPIRGETDSLDNLAVTREEFRVGIGQLLEYLAQALGGVDTTYEDQPVDPTAVVLQGEPVLDIDAVPEAADDSLRVPSTSWVQDEIAGLLDDYVAKTGGVMTGDLRVPSLNGGALAGLRNMLINGDFRIDQRNTGGAYGLTAGAAFIYGADRWLGFCSGANVSAQRITVAGTQVDPNRMQFNGAASVTAIGIGQRIEAASSRHLAGRQATLSANFSNSLLTTVSWEAFYANSSDSFGTRASPTRTSFASGTFAVTSSYTRYSATFDVPAAATTGIEIVFTVGAQTSGTWVVGQAQLEEGVQVTPFERRPLGLETALCQRYFTFFPVNVRAAAPGAGALYAHSVSFPQRMRANPTLGSIVPDPEGPGALNLNGAGITVTGATTYGVLVQMVVNSPGADSYYLHFRASATAEL
ncbi:tail fiber protein [Cyanophage S-2L]|nr:tail fiber protein [Cyanophage S-2L]